LAKELVELAPGEFGKVFFASGGAEGVDAAMKMARIATGREKMVYCHRSYHGLTFGALAVTGNHEFRDGFGPLVAGTMEIPFGDLAALERALAGKDVAAFIVEPIQGKGVNIPEAGYLKGVAELCAKYGTLFILDEIQTGFGRTGKWWACQHDGGGKTWQPDILLTAKALSAGAMPTSAVLCRDWIHTKVFPSMNHCSRIQNTFSMNDLSMVAGLAVLHVMRQEKIVENSKAVGEHLMAGLRALMPKYPIMKQVRGRGLMIAIEFGRPAGLRNLALATGWDLLHKADPSLFCQSMLMPLMTDHHVLAQVAGHRLDVIKLTPPLVLSDKDADEVIAAMDKVIGAIHTFPGPAWEVGKKLTAAAVKRFG
jgi:acetylornithine/succinyldiaminopimelate/putrescine aminotransferase